MKKIIGVIIVLLLSYWMVRPLFIAGYFPMHDDTQIARVVVMGRALRQGQFPVRWVSDLGYGYGYPIFNFYGPLPYYVGGALYALGLSGLTATKIMMGAGLVLAGVTMYVAMADILGVSAGVLAAAFYMYAPYHGVDAYVRGAVGEYWGLVFLPLIFWGFWRKKILTGALGIAGLIISHTILGYMGMLFVGIAVVVTNMQKKLILMAALGLGLSAFFWLPAISEMKYTNVASVIGASADYRNHFVCLSQLWNSLWGFGGSAPGCLDGLTFKIGKEHIILGLIAGVGMWGVLRNKIGRMITAAGLGIFTLSVFLMLPISAWVWSVIPLFPYIQYPWRFLAFAVFGISVVVSCIPLLMKHTIIRWLAVLGCVILVIGIEAKRFVPQYIVTRPAIEHETDVDIRFRASKVSDEYLPEAVIRPKNINEIPCDTIATSDSYQIENLEIRDTYKKIAFHTGNDIRVKINLAYFPGWQYIVNVDDVVPDIQNGLPVIGVPAGDSVVQIFFRNTPVRLFGNALSLLSVGFWLYLYDKRRKIIG